MVEFLLRLLLFFSVKKGNKIHYVYTSDELKVKMKELDGKGEIWVDFKRLGEMNDEQLWGYNDES